MIFLDTILVVYYWLKIQDYTSQSDSGTCQCMQVMFNTAGFLIFTKCMAYLPVKVGDTQFKVPVEGIPPYRIRAFDWCHTVYYNNLPANRCVFIKVNFII